MDETLTCDYLDDEDFQAWLAAHEDDISLPSFDDINVTGNSTPSKKPQSPKLPSLLGLTESLESITERAMDLRPNTAVELHDGTFLLIAEIVRQRESQHVYLRGQEFRRTLKLDKQLQKLRNEVCWIVKAIESDLRDPTLQSMKEVPLSHVVKHRFIRKTNLQFPALSFRDDPTWGKQYADATEQERKEMMKQAGEEAVLVCRLKQITFYKNERNRSLHKPVEQAFLRLEESECDSDDMSSVPADQLRYGWRGDTPKGGACDNWLRGEKEFLRQEELCREGRVCRQSLESATHKWPVGDPMKRGCIGELVTEEDLLEDTLGDGSSCPSTLASTFSPTTKRRPGIRSQDNYSPKRFKYPPALSNALEEERPQTQPRVIDLTRAQIPGTIEKHKTFAPKPKSVQSRPESSSHRVYPSRNPGTNARTLSFWQKRGSTKCRSPFHIPRSRYTLGDAFCGCGGMSRGAVMARLRVVWGFDFDLAACESYLCNNFEAKVYNLWADQFIHLPDHYDLRVDILHLSPPCQFFSPAHTHAGKNDEQNTASLFAIDTLIKRCKPRIVTMEQTAGLSRPAHRGYFNATIHICTSNGYNVRWRLLNCADFGIPQRRLRLFIFASCPGEPLPPFPKPTHTKYDIGTGLKPWATISSAINIPEDWPDHDIDDAIERDTEPFSAEDVTNCICASGGGITHPSGKRDYTDRELACLSTFPLYHKFGEFETREVRKQIGNAVPPLMAKILLETVKETLMKTDGIL